MKLYLSSASWSTSSSVSSRFARASTIPRLMTDQRTGSLSMAMMGPSSEKNDMSSEKAAVSVVAVAAPSRAVLGPRSGNTRSEEHTSELQSLMRSSYAVFCLKKKQQKHKIPTHD